MHAENSISTKPLPLERGNSHHLRIACLTTAYPSVSHTFIRREILSLESMGHSVTRIAIRPGQAFVDPEDRQEQLKTYHILGQPRARLIRHIFAGLLAVRFRLFRGLAESFCLYTKSDRGLLRHIAYFVESLALISKLRQERCNHVHVHFGTNAAAVALLAKVMSGTPFSMTIHGPDEFDAFFGFSLRRKMSQASFTVAISNFGAAQLKRWLQPQEWGRVHVVRCSVGQRWFEHSRPVDTDAKTLVCVGRLSSQKGQIVLIDAFARVASDYPDVNLKLVGDGELRADIETRIREHGLEQRVKITGWCNEEEVRGHLATARAVVVSSFAEGLPVVIMEAMALRRPVLSTSIMGIPELVRDGENGWLTITGNIESLAQGISRVCEADIEELRRMGDNGQALVRKQHWTANETKLLERLFRRYSQVETANVPAPQTRPRPA